MAQGAPTRLTKRLITCLLVLLCTFGLCGCDFGGLFKTTKDKEAAPAEQVEKASGEQAKEGEDAQEEAPEESTSEAAESSSSSGSNSSSGSGSSSSGEPSPEPEPVTLSIHVSVDATAAGRGYFADTTVTLPEGATVYDVLVATGLSFGGDSNYVRSINGLSEFDVGSGSGWMYSVNGNVPMVPCGGYVLSDGDDVCWYYVTGDKKDM